MHGNPQKLDLYWSKANPNVKQKILVYDAVIRAKLLHGLESTAMNKTVKHSLDVFQLKGLRKILGVKTTYIDRTQDNKKVMETAQEKIDEATPHGKTQKQLKPFSEVWQERKMKLFNKIITAKDDCPLRSVTFQKNH